MGDSYPGGFGDDHDERLRQLWEEAKEEICLTDPDPAAFKNQTLPLARIKKIMKLDEDVRMISAEAPVVFAKACEFFVMELTQRAWQVAEENKRRTLQRSDVAQAIQAVEVFDFLLDIVPLESSSAGDGTEECAAECAERGESSARETVEHGPYEVGQPQYRSSNDAYARGGGAGYLPGQIQNNIPVRPQAGYQPAPAIQRQQYLVSGAGPRYGAGVYSRPGTSGAQQPVYAPFPQGALGGGQVYGGPGTTQQQYLQRQYQQNNAAR